MARVDVVQPPRRRLVVGPEQAREAVARRVRAEQPVEPPRLALVILRRLGPRGRAHGAVDHAGQQGGRDALARDVPDHERDAAGAGPEHVVEVAAHLLRGTVDGRGPDGLAAVGPRGQQLRLHGARELQLALHAPAALVRAEAQARDHHRDEQRERPGGVHQQVPPDRPQHRGVLDRQRRRDLHDQEGPPSRARRRRRAPAPATARGRVGAGGAGGAAVGGGGPPGLRPA